MLFGRHLEGALAGESFQLDYEETEQPEDQTGSLGKHSRGKPECRHAYSAYPAALAPRAEVIDQRQKTGRHGEIGRGETGMRQQAGLTSKISDR